MTRPATWRHGHEEESDVEPAGLLDDIVASQDAAIAREHRVLADRTFTAPELDLAGLEREGIASLVAEHDSAGVSEQGRIAALGPDVHGTSHASFQDAMADPGFALRVEHFVEIVQDALVSEGKDRELTASSDPVVVASQRELVERAAHQLVGEHFNLYEIGADGASALVDTVVDDVCGLGPIEELMADPAVTEIIARWDEPVIVERHGVLQATAVRFRSGEQLRRVAQRVATLCGRKVDESSPLADAWLPDGSRVNVVLPPVSALGPVLTVRRFAEHHRSLADLVDSGALSAEMAELLRRCVVAKVNIVVAGGTGTGKTTVLRSLAMEIPRAEYIVTIEDINELRLTGYCPQVSALVKREPAANGSGGVAIRDLVINALRMRPDRIVVGEVRGKEALDMLQSLCTGHDGGLSTVHANGPGETLRVRLPTLAASAENTPFEQALIQTNLAVELIVQVWRAPTGERGISGIYGVEVDDENPARAAIYAMYERDESGDIACLAQPAGRVAVKLGSISATASTASREPVAAGIGYVDAHVARAA
ncbi:MAG: CpaF family protein, partial [Acidimicrobiales bacterium]